MVLSAVLPHLIKKILPVAWAAAHAGHAAIVLIVRGAILVAPVVSVSPVPNQNRFVLLLLNLAAAKPPPKKVLAAPARHVPEVIAGSMAVNTAVVNTKFLVFISFKSVTFLANSR
jgi:hypothetical protein